MNSTQALSAVIICLSALYLTIAIAVSPADSVRNSCHAQCDPIPTWIRFEECLRACYSQSPPTGKLILTTVHVETTTAVLKKYPDRPSNMIVTWNVHIERYTKYLRATVYWEAPLDSLREGFYLSFLPTDEKCEALFPGYYTQNIPRDASSWEIPAHLPGLQPLTIDYGCVYRVEVRSKPYPYGDPKYTLIEKFEVPTCVDGYCSCKKQRKLPPPADVFLDFYIDQVTKFGKAKVKWQYDVSMDTDHFSDHKTPNVQFTVMLADLFRKPTVAPWKNLFKWRQWNSTVSANVNQTEYETELPDVKSGMEYKMQIFAVNEHMCKSEPVEQEFVFSIMENASPANTEVVSSSTLASEKKNSTSIIDETKETTDKINETSAEPNQRKIDSHPSQNRTGADERTIVPKTTPTIAVETVKTVYTRDEYFLVVFLPIIAILCLISTGFAICKFYAARKENLLKKQHYFERMAQFPWTLLTHASTSPSMETNILYTEKEIIDARARGLADEYEISYERLAFGRVIGQGAFGLVYLGNAMAINNIAGLTRVAIKQLKANADERERFEFLEEIAIMKKVGHHANIVTMYGCCTLQYPHCMVMEYVPYGDLLRYLRNLRKEYEKQIEEYRISLERDYIMQLNTHPLMTHAEINAAVRSLINSNPSLAKSSTVTGNEPHDFNGTSLSYEGSNDDCPIPFVDDEVEGEIGTAPQPSMDISQLTYTLDPAELQSFAFQVACGMNHLEQLNVTHRDLAARNILVGHGKTLKISDFGLSRMGIYVKTTSGRIPLRWLSIEAMRDHTYSTKSDVWAYGTVLWEICTLGGFPYPTIADKDLLHYLESGSRLEKPSSCSTSVFRLMLQCWAHSPTHRPSFAHIKKTLNDMNKEASPYVEFSPGAAVDSISALPPQEYCKIAPSVGLQSDPRSSQATMTVSTIDNDNHAPL